MLTTTEPQKTTRARSDAPLEPRGAQVEVPTRAKPVRWLLAAVLVVSLIGSVIVALTMTRGPAAEDSSDAIATGPAVGTQLHLAQLANQGYIPREAVDQQRLLLERLVALGDIPAATLRPAREIVEPLYTGAELRLIEAVAAGHIPRETLDTEAFRLKQLANEGYIPRAATR